MSWYDAVKNIRKPYGEGAVCITERQIIAALRNQEFHSFEEAHDAFHKRYLEVINEHLNRLGCSRREYYEREERPYMKRLPAFRYDVSSFGSATVPKDFCIKIHENRYSVPYTLCHETVLYRVVDDVIHIYDSQWTEVATHTLQKAKRRYPIILFEHRPKNQQAVLGYNQEEFLKYACQVGPETTKAFKYYLERGKEPEQGYQFCVSLRYLGESHGTEMLEEACAAAQSGGALADLKIIESYLVARAAAAADNAPDSQAAHPKDTPNDQPPDTVNAPTAAPANDCQTVQQKTEGLTRGEAQYKSPSEPLSPHTCSEGSPATSKSLDEV